MMVSKCASDNRDDLCIGVIDVRRAYFYAPTKRRVFVQLPPEDYKPGDEEMCGLLQYSFHGTRDAAQSWGEEISGSMEAFGFKQGRSNPCVFHRVGKDMSAAIHGDDVICCGKRCDVEELINKFKRKYEIKWQLMGEAADLDKQVKMLNRTPSWTALGIEWMADPRHANDIIEGLGLRGAHSVAAPCDLNEHRAKDPRREEKLDQSAATQYRSLAAKVNYLAIDRPDLKYPAMNICAAMSEPSHGDLERLKRLARYLIGHATMAQVFRWQKRPGKVTCYSDSDRAGDKTTRRSTSAGVIMFGTHTLKTWSKKQQVVALSSCEAELYAGTKCAAEGIGIQSLCRDLGMECKVEVLLDSTAALALGQRQGLGKAKHIQIQDLWLQEGVRERKFGLSKVASERNLADLGTKGLTPEVIARHLRGLGYQTL